MEGTAAQGRRKDQNKGAKLKKRGGTAAPTTQVRLLKSASTKRLMLLVLKVCTAQPPMCAFVRHSVWHYHLSSPCLEPHLLSSWFADWTTWLRI